MYEVPPDRGPPAEEREAIGCYRLLIVNVIILIIVIILSLLS